MEKCNNVIMKAFKNCGLALAIAAALVMTTASCSSENDLVETPNVEQPQVTTNGVQITVGAGFDDASTRSAVVIDGTKHVLTFTNDDKLYVYGDIDENKVIAGYLTMNGAPTNENKSAQFTGNYGTDLKAYSWNGTQYAETSHSFSTADILGECSNVKAVLVDANSTFTVNPTYKNYKMSGTFAGSAPTVDDLMTKGLEVKGDYVSASHSFTLSNNNTIFNCTFSGLTPSTTYKVCQALSDTYFTFYNFTTDANGAGTIAFIAAVNSIVNTYFISVFNNNDTEVGSIPLGTRSFESKIYNVSRHWTGSEFVKSLYLPYVKSNVTVADGTMLIGKLASNVKISIAAGATVTLDGVTINGVNSNDYKWAGITCLGDATLDINGTNTVQRFNSSYPCIQAGPANTTLTIRGTGSLDASSNTSYGSSGIGAKSGGSCGNITIEGAVTVTAIGGDGSAGIGCGDILIEAWSPGAYQAAQTPSCCGDITIQGSANVTATGGDCAAGIGTGKGESSNTKSICGNILISGTATVNATGSMAGIGSSWYGQCGTITIESGVSSVTATKGDPDANIIGAGYNSTCGTLTIDGVADATPSSTFTHFNSALSNSNNTWTLTHK